MKASEILERGAEILNQRGSEYEVTTGGGERSFAAVATAFNAITGRDLHADEICLIQSLVKDVRQYAQDRLHEDSVVDGVNYKALQGEELYKRYGASLPVINGVTCEPDNAELLYGITKGCKKCQN